MPVAGATGSPRHPRLAAGDAGFGGRVPERVCDAGPRSFAIANMDATALDVLTALLSLVSAVGVLIVNGKVDRLTGRGR